MDLPEYEVGGSSDEGWTVIDPKGRHLSTHPSRLSAEIRADYENRLAGLK